MQRTEQGEAGNNPRRWLCLPALLFCAVDATLTLAGQDPEYWAGGWSPVNEANPVGKVLLSLHAVAFLAGIACWCVVFCLAILRLPEPLAVVTGLGVAVSHAVGAATWLLIWNVAWPWSLVAAILLLVGADAAIWQCWKRFRGPALDSGEGGQREWRRLFAYDAWANREAAAALRKAAAPPPRALQLLAHIAAAQQIWWARLQGEPAGTPVWPELTLEQSEAALAELEVRWQKFLADLSASGLARGVSYSNFAGERWVTPVAEILHHVVLHGGYHRGQIATYLRLAGCDAAATDYIVAVRRGLPE
jgi:uncharacterized damage-inducible protein DinB